MRTQELRFPCAGCGRKTPVGQLHPVMHGTFASRQWHIDKRCERCGGGDDPTEFAEAQAPR